MRGTYGPSRNCGRRGRSLGCSVLASLIGLLAGCSDATEVQLHEFDGVQPEHERHGPRQGAGAFQSDDDTLQPITPGEESEDLGALVMNHVEAGEVVSFTGSLADVTLDFSWVEGGAWAVQVTQGTRALSPGEDLRPEDEDKRVLLEVLDVVMQVSQGGEMSARARESLERITTALVNMIGVEPGTLQQHIGCGQCGWECVNTTRAASAKVLGWLPTQCCNSCLDQICGWTQCSIGCSNTWCFPYISGSSTQCVCTADASDAQFVCRSCCNCATSHWWTDYWCHCSCWPGCYNC